MSLKSVRKLGIASSILFAVAAILGIVGLIGGAVAALAAALVVWLVLMQVFEQRRRALHREQMSEFRRLNQAVAENAAAQQKSLGLLFREVRVVSSELCGDDSILTRESEKAVSIYLHAIRLAKAEVLDSVESRRSDLEVGSK